MKIAPTWEYGLRCLLQIARAQEEKPLSIPQVAKEEGLSAAYVGKLLNRLGKAGIVQGHRGRRGGYVLAKDAAAISLYEVFQALADPLSRFEDCQSYPGALQECIHIVHNPCSILPVWRRLDLLVKRTLSSVTLQEVLEKGTEYEQNREWINGQNGAALLVKQA
jgi:Rrf2 family protein